MPYCNNPTGCGSWLVHKDMTTRFSDFFREFITANRPASAARGRFIEYKRILKYSNVTSVALRNSAGAYVAPGFQQTAVPPSALPSTLASGDWDRVQLTSSSASRFSHVPSD